MDLNVRQQKAVDLLRSDKVAQISSGESVTLDGETFPAAMFDKLVGMGIIVKHGKNNDRVWMSK